MTNKMPNSRSWRSGLYIPHHILVGEVLKRQSYLISDGNGIKYIVLPPREEGHGKKVVPLNSDDAFEFYSEVYSELTNTPGAYYTDRSFPAHLSTVKAQPEKAYKHWAMITNPDGSRTLWHDLNRPDRIGIKIDEHNWTPAPLNDVLFHYDNTLDECPMPIRNGKPFIQYMDKYLQVLPPEDRVIVTAILVSYMRASMTNVITMLFDKSGHGKNTFAKVMSLFLKFRENPTGLVEQKRDFTDRQIVTYLSSNWHLALGHVSNISDSLSNVLCAFAAGANHGVRTLKVDGKEFSVDKSVPLIISAVRELRINTELQCLSYTFRMTKAKTNWLTEEQLFDQIYQEYPEMLGSLYDLVAVSMKNIKHVSKVTTQMHLGPGDLDDFILCGMAIAEELKKGECNFTSFLALIQNKRRQMEGITIAQEPLAFHTHKILGETTGEKLTLSPTELVDEVNARRRKDNPNMDIKVYYPNHIVKHLDDLAPILAAFGIEFNAPEAKPKRTTRYIHFMKVKDKFDAAATDGICKEEDVAKLK